MNQCDKNLAEMLELAASEDERGQLEEIWRSLEALSTDGALPAPAPAFSADRPHTRSIPGHRWSKAAALFGAGLLTGALAAQFMDSQSRPRQTGNDPIRATARAALSANRTPAERLAAVHAVGKLAPEQEWALDELVQQVLLARTTAIQLAALDALSKLELTPVVLDLLSRRVADLDSPIVQIMLLDILSGYETSFLRAALERLTTERETDPLVRRHADRTLALQEQRRTT